MKVLIFGRLPPPIGGVTSSVKNLVVCLEKLGIVYCFFSFNILSSFGSECSHINYSSPVKRFFAVVISKFLSGKVVFVIHGSSFNDRNIFNRLSLRFTDGVVVLNENIERLLSTKGVAVKKLTSIFVEGITVDSGTKAKFELPLGSSDKKKVLIYINNDRYLEGKEIYGATFFCEAMVGIEEKNILPVVLDLSRKYKESCHAAFGSNLIYIDNAIDFKNLLLSVDVYVRPTNFDGSSVAVLEALCMGVPVVASDVVDRPEGCIVYRTGSKASFRESLKVAISSCAREDGPPRNALSSVYDLLNFVEKL